MLFVSCVCHIFVFVYCGLWSPDLLALVCDVNFVMLLPFGSLGQVWYLILSIPYPCCLSYFYIQTMSKDLRQSPIKSAAHFLKPVVKKKHN